MLECNLLGCNVAFLKGIEKYKVFIVGDFFGIFLKCRKLNHF
jgi:hypothetical protein